MSVHRGKTTEALQEGSPLREQGERPQKKPNLPAPWPWTSSFYMCEKINRCCFSKTFVMAAALAN